MMGQDLEIKQAQQDGLLFYRMGDFYEMFFQDAEQASAALDIALTKRGQHLGEDIPMCGVPVHSADGYLARSEEHTSELQSLMRISYAVFCLKKKTTTNVTINTTDHYLPSLYTLTY